MASDGSPLPSARAVSVTVHRPVYRDDPKFTVMLAVWGQFMDHDVTATALSLGTSFIYYRFYYYPCNIALVMIRSYSENVDFLWETRLHFCSQQFCQSILSIILL